MTDVMDTPTGDELRNEVVVTLEGRDTRIPMESLDGLTMEATDETILDSVRGIIQEQRDVDIADNRGEYAFAVRKAFNTNTIYVYPKPVAG